MSTNKIKIVGLFLVVVFLLATNSVLPGQENQSSIPVNPRVSNVKIDEIIKEKYISFTISAIPGHNIKEIDINALKFKINESKLEDNNIDTKIENNKIICKLRIPPEIKTEKIKLEVFYKENLIKSADIILPGGHQEDHLKITYDFLDNLNPLNDGKKEEYTATFRKHVTFRVVNVNPFLYRVKIISTLKDYFIETPKIYAVTAKEAMEMKETKIEKQAIPEALEEKAKEAAEAAEKEEEEGKKELKEEEDASKTADDTSKASLAKSEESKKLMNKTEKELADKDNEIKEYEDCLAIERDNESKITDEIKKQEEERRIKSESGVEKFVVDAIDTAIKGKNDLLDNLKKSIGAIEKKISDAKESKGKIENTLNQNKKVYESDRTKAENDSLIYKVRFSTYEEKKKKLEEKSNKLRSIRDFLNSYKNIAKIIDIYNSLISLVFVPSSYEDIQGKVKEIILSMNNSNINENNLIPKFRKWLNNAFDNYDKIDFIWLQDSKYQRFEWLTTEHIEKIKLCRKNIEKLRNIRIIEKIDTILNNLTKENFEHSLTIPNVEVDEIQFMPNIEPLIDSPYSYIHNKLDKPVVVRVRGGWIINFSTGVLFNINSHNRTYKLEKVATESAAGNQTDEANYIIRENEDKISVTPTVTALMHIYPRSVDNVRWGGIVFGIGTKELERFHYYFGTSFMCGLQKRFVLNAGMVLTKIDYLKAGYEKDIEVKLPINTEPNDLIEQKLKLRLFIGFTYNLSSN